MTPKVPARLDRNTRHPRSPNHGDRWIQTIEESATVMLALQLRSPFYVGSAGFGLMCAAPDGPCDDVGGPDASLRKTNSDAPDFLNCPADQELGGPFIPRFFFWASCCSPDAGLLPSWRRRACQARHGDASHARSGSRYGRAPVRSWPSRNYPRSPNDDPRS